MTDDRAEGVEPERGAEADWEPPVEALDFLYMPSTDVAADLAFYEDRLGARVVFAIEAIGTRVAEVQLSAGGPRLILAGHLHGEAPVLLHRVKDLEAALKALEDAEVDVEARFEIPQGPVCTLRTPGGQRLGLYELTRPEVDRGFRGRRDF
jgi:catechol 2,3-dioxygenase-like lactoylglutathione lyase family enzyme